MSEAIPEQKRGAPERAADLARLARELATLSDELGDEERESELKPEPDPVRLAEALLEVQRLIRMFLPKDLFSDPARNLILDLYVAEKKGQPMPVSSACIAADVPSTTALRWINNLRKRGLVLQELDPVDRRRIFVRLEPEVLAACDRYLRKAAIRLKLAQLGG